MRSVPSVSVTGWYDGATEAATLGASDGATLGAADAGATDEAADDGEADPPPLHAARNAASPAKPVPARKPRRLTFVLAIRAKSASSSRSLSVIRPSSSSRTTGSTALTPRG